MMNIHHESVDAQTSTDAVERGIGNFVQDYALLGERDHALILYTPECRALAARVVLAARALGVAAYPVAMRPLKDDDFEGRLASFLPSDLKGRRLVVVTLERETMSHGLSLRRSLSRYSPDSVSVLRVINASDEFFAHAVSVPPEQLSQINSGLLHRFMPASRLSVKSDSGTDLEIDLESTRFRWLSNRGVWRAGAFSIFPPGEVSTYAANVNGVLVADGAFNVTAYTGMDVRLRENPLTVQVEDQRMVEYSCDDPMVMELVRRCLSYENADRVGEVGIGTNFGIPDFIAMNSHINERRPGLHLGFGQHGQKRSVVDYMSEVHLDLITDGSTFDPHDGQGVIHSSDFAPSDLPHPTDVDDEDIDGDCCGIFNFN